MVRISATCPASWVRTEGLETAELTCCRSSGHEGPHLDASTEEEWSE